MDSFSDDLYTFQLEKALKNIKKFKSKKLKDAGLDITSDQWLIVKQIDAQPGINQRSLSGVTFKDPASITRTLDLLVSKSLIERRSSENNRREFLLYLTEDGKDLIHRILPVAIDVRARGTKGLTEDDMQELRRILTTIADNFES